MNKDLNDARRSSDGSQTIPAELHEMHQRLLEDGARWRSEIPLVTADHVWAYEGSAPVAHRATSERRDSAAVKTPPPHPTRRDTNLARGLVASLAILLVVGLLATIFATFGRGKNGARLATTPTAGVFAPWTVVPRLANQPAPPIIAPSDPAVVYEAALTGPNSEHIFRRSDDAGATWRDLPVPDGGLSAYALGDLAIWVDPANAQNVVATLGRLLPPGNERDCPTLGATAGFARQGAATPNTPGSGSGGCHLQYFSADGGLHWSEMRFPVPGSMTSGWGVSLRTLTVLQSQGTRLYTAIHYRGESGLVRVFVSQDRGATWTLADNGLYGQGHSICDYRVVPDSNTLYATTGRDECFQMITPQPITLWRSDDAGAHWSQMGQLPGSAAILISAVKRSGHPEPALAIAAFDKARAERSERAWVSEDGGRQWTAAPDQSVNDTLNVFMGGPRDGSLIQITQSLGAILQPLPQGTPTTPGIATATPSPVGVSGGATSRPHADFTSWSPGQTGWRQIAQSLEGTDVVYAAVSHDAKNGTPLLWAVTTSADVAGNATYSVRTVTLS
jgi:hypothetical protein